MEQEIGQFKNIAWVRRLGLAKGSLQARVVGYHKCCFCGRWDRSKRPDLKPRARKVFSSAGAGICNKCVKKYKNEWFSFGRKRKRKCSFCSKRGGEVKRLFTVEKYGICDQCVAEFWKGG